jgi:hypothetical protein
MKNLKVGQRIKFQIEGTNDVYTRKIYSIYNCGFNSSIIKYNTRGISGGYASEGFSVEPHEIIKAY